MKKFTLANGFVFRSWYGGQPVRGGVLPNGKTIGDCSRIRKYREFERIDAGGIEWLEWTDGSIADYYSLCGRFHVPGYMVGGGWREFYCFSACVWRENMQSTFGNYTKGLEKTTFRSFEEAAKAIAAAL